MRDPDGDGNVLYLYYTGQYAGSTVVLQFYKTCPLGETTLKVHGISPYCFLQLNVNLQLSQDKINFKKERGYTEFSTQIELTHSN